MSAMSDHLESLVANAVLRGTVFPAIGPVSMALCVSPPPPATPTPPSEAVGGNINEATYPGYQRAGLGTPSEAWSAPTTGGLVTNLKVITFPAHSGQPGSAAAYVTHWAMLDGTGNLLFTGAMTTPKSIEPGDVPSFPIGSIQLTFA